MTNIIELLRDTEVEWRELGGVSEIGTGSGNTQDAFDDGKYLFMFAQKTLREVKNNFLKLVNFINLK